MSQIINKKIYKIFTYAGGAYNFYYFLHEKVFRFNRSDTRSQFFSCQLTALDRCINYTRQKFVDKYGRTVIKFISTTVKIDDPENENMSRCCHRRRRAGLNVAKGISSKVSRQGKRQEKRTSLKMLAGA